MKKRFIVLSAILLSLALTSCGSTVDLDTPKSSELSQAYEYYQDSVNSLRSTMGISPEESDDVFIVLTDCGVDEKITQVYKNGTGNDVHYTVWYGLNSLDVYLDGNTVNKVLKSGVELYPTAATESTDSEKESVSTSDNEPVTYTADSDSLKQLFTDTLSVKNNDLSVTYDDINSCYSVSYFYASDFWDETNFVNNCISDYVTYCKEAYSIDGVTNVDFHVSINMKDSYGNSEPSEVFHFRMNKDSFDKFNWDNLKFDSIYDNFSSNCEFFWIYPGVLQKVDTSKIYYAP